MSAGSWYRIEKPYERAENADVIALFQSDASIGMMGVYGGADLPKDGCYTPFWDTGRVLCYQVFEVSELNSNVLSPFGI